MNLTNYFLNMEKQMLIESNKKLNPLKKIWFKFRFNLLELIIGKNVVIANCRFISEENRGQVTIIKKYSRAYFINVDETDISGHKLVQLVEQKCCKDHA